ncbi:hypothetical protein like AT5G01150 [Hibiscus trionum]|uniref:DUF674 domain-containing protein n=1 Tax=Hibiscus trionum TaxID=183268 RepID=A0A9W7I0E9_HIBTR|nr:hypothetical protein like AT5G01150 [Hibiscus trionum]
MAATTVSLKLLIDLKSRRVLFAKAGKDFVDFLFNIMSLSVGTVTRLLTEKGMVGSLGNLYGSRSIENLGDAYLQSAATKDTLLKPMVSDYGTNNVPLLFPHMQSPTSATNLYSCGRCNNVANDLKFICPDCSDVMDQNVDIVNVTSKGSSSSEGGYVKGVVTYMVMDDLVVRPMSTISSITLLNMLKVQDVGFLEEKVIDVGVDENQVAEGIVAVQSRSLPMYSLGKMELKYQIKGCDVLVVVCLFWKCCYALKYNYE